MAARFRVKIIGGLILAAAVVIAALTFQSAGPKRKLEVYKAQLLAQGEKLKVSELVPVPPAGSFENAQGFLSALSLSRTVSNYPPVMKLVAPGRAMVAWKQEVLPEDNVSNIWPGLLLQLKQNQGGLSKLQSALDVPVLYFNLDYSQGWGILLPHLARIKQAEILAAASAEAALHERNYGEAWTNLHFAVTLTRRYQAEPILISHLVRIAIAQIAIGATWECLQFDQCTEAQLSELQSDWQAMDFFNGPEAAFAMERAISIETFQQARKSYDILAGTGFSSRVAGNSSSGLFSDLARHTMPTVANIYERYPKYWSWKRSWSFDEELFALQNYDAIIKAFRRIQHSGPLVPALKEFDANVAEINKAHVHATNHFMFGGLDGEVGHNSLLKFADTEVARRLLVTAIALKRYQLRHDSLPSNLNALVPDILSQVPMDLMDGKPLRYRLKQDGNFLLYSVGEDGEDNGGDPAPASNAKTVWYKGRDIVWPQPATTDEIEAYYKTNLTASLPPNRKPSNGSPKETNAPDPRRRGL